MTNKNSSLTHTGNGSHIITDDEILTLIRKVEELSSYGLTVADYNTTGCPGNGL